MNAFTFGTGYAYAQDLDQLIRELLGCNPSILAERGAVDAKRAQVVVARSNVKRTSVSEGMTKPQN